MATTRGVAGVFFQHAGTFLLFAATLLLVITCVSSPVTHDIALLRVELNDTGTRAWGVGRERVVSFGTFGWCELGFDGNGTDICSRPQVGYSPCSILSAPSNLTHNLTLPLPNPWGSSPVIAFSDDVRKTTDGLTRGMILHPIACGLCFLAFLLCLYAGTAGLKHPRGADARLVRFLSVLTALAALVATLLACILDFVLWSLVKRVVDGYDGPDEDEERKTTEVTGTGTYGAGAWTLLIAALCTAAAGVVLVGSCCCCRGRGGGGGEEAEEKGGGGAGEEVGGRGGGGTTYTTIQIGGGNVAEGNGR
ncbi:hypothetical protein VTJ49DRAFT_5633 [Mycothermus thermophilus]|uniref:Uncharacterized protein n=1 Tax=Humicola insolens TaxID=85995 RepID=A0ABR3V2P4_HUMIN